MAESCLLKAKAMPGFFRLAEFTLNVRPLVSGSIVQETSGCLYAKSTTYVKFLESEAEQLGVRMTVFEVRPNFCNSSRNSRERRFMNGLPTPLYH
jgi:hypothetical protein